MDAITLATIIGAVVAVLGLIYLVFFGQKSLPELWRGRREKRKSARGPATPGQEATPAPPPVNKKPIQPPHPTASSEFVYDVFISYSHNDEEWVTKTLLPRLEEAGLRVCIDYRDFTAGRAALLNMQDAALHSRHTVLVLTPAWVASEWTLYESLLIRTKDPAGLQRRTIPLLLQASELPEFISMLTWVDFTRPERRDIAWTQLLIAIGAPPEAKPAEEPKREQWLLAHPYPMPPNFTGREAERKMLSEWLNAEGEHSLLILRALGGFGKSALVWHWLLHDVDPRRWPRVVWWSFYEGDASFERFLEDTLPYLGSDPRGLGPRQQVDELLRRLRQSGILLVLDGFERALRAYSGMGAAYQGDEAGLADGGKAGDLSQRDCVSTHAELLLRSLGSLPGMIHSKVLMTTRLRPRILEAHGSQLLEGCREEVLTQMQPADAEAFFLAQGIRGSRAEIENACAPYGFHPLSLRLLAGLIVSDLQQPGDIAAARRLEVSGDLVQRRHHVLEQAYESLAPARRRLLSRIACFRSPVGYEALHALAEEIGDEAEVNYFDGDLRDLQARSLLHHDLRAKRFDLHPIVRRYAYDRLAGDERVAAHTRLRDYFAAVPSPQHVQKLDDLLPVTERFHHTVRAGHYDEALNLFRDRISRPAYYQFGAYQLLIELLRALIPDGEDKPPRLRNENDQAWTLNALANSYGLSGQPRQSVKLRDAANALVEKQGHKPNLAIGLGNLGQEQLAVGSLQAAEANLRRSIALCLEIENQTVEAVGHQELGRLLAYRGKWAEVEEELAAGLALFEKVQEVQSEGVVYSYRALRELLMVREGSPSAPLLKGEGGRGPVYEAVGAARRALELADEDARTDYPVERDYVRAHWLSGSAHRANGDTVGAERHLSQALTRCRSINMVDHEADILLELARLRTATGGREEALRLAEEALIITERSEYVLQGADVHLFLAQMALEDADKPTALDHAREARRLATCDGPPDYTYKVAYDEAGALLERMGLNH